MITSIQAEERLIEARLLVETALKRSIKTGRWPWSRIIYWYRFYRLVFPFTIASQKALFAANMKSHIETNERYDRAFRELMRKYLRFLHNLEKGIPPLKTNEHFMWAKKIIISLIS